MMLARGLPVPEAPLVPVNISFWYWLARVDVDLVMKI
jgi:hypothetical protein